MSSIQLYNRLLPVLSFGKTVTSHYGQHITHIRWFHFSSVLIHGSFEAEKPFVDVNERNTKQMLIPLRKTSIIPLIGTSLTPISSNKRPSICQRIIRESKHYYHGSKLLCIETKIVFRLVRQMMNGHTLTRREKKQFTRTMVDLFRLIPFSIFIIVPFLEFTLPIFLKLFPNMLPSTFKQIEKEREKWKKQSSIKLEVSKFLQETIFKSIKRTSAHNVQPSIEEIIKFSVLFKNQLMLDNLHRQQLIALCKLLDLAIVGPNSYLRLKLQLKFHRLKIDDKLIANEGIENLTIEELRLACHERGMNSLDISIEQLQSQLQQWLDLHINNHIPITILLLSNVFYLPKTHPDVIPVKVIDCTERIKDSVSQTSIANICYNRTAQTPCNESAFQMY